LRSEALRCAADLVQLHHGEYRIDAELKMVHDAGIGIVGMKVMAGGGRVMPFYPTTEETRSTLKKPGAVLASLKWVLRSKYMDTTIPSMVDIDQLEENLTAMGEAWRPTDEKLLAECLEQMKPSYCRMCGACSGTCPKGLPVSDLLRFAMYADGYGQFAVGRENFQQLPASVRDVRCNDCTRMCSFSVPTVCRSRAGWRARRNCSHSSLPATAYHCSMALLWCALAVLGVTASAANPVPFKTQEIATKLGVVYALSIADVNGDGKPDIVAITNSQLLWFENPWLDEHLIAERITEKDNVAVAPMDIDRDGKLDFALAADWQSTNTTGGGSLHWITNAGQVHHITTEPTLHRIGWIDVDGDRSSRTVVVPLHGRGTKPPELDRRTGRAHSVFKVPKNPAKDPWKAEVADDTLHIVHNFIGVGREIWVAAAEGVFALSRGEDGKWSRRKIAEGRPGEIKLGRAGKSRYLATVEPWHGNSVVLFTKRRLFPGNEPSLTAVLTRDTPSLGPISTATATTNSSRAGAASLGGSRCTDSNPASGSRQ
jgi:ferredoxin